MDKESESVLRLVEANSEYFKQMQVSERKYNATCQHINLPDFITSVELATKSLLETKQEGKSFVPSETIGDILNPNDYIDRTSIEFLNQHKSRG